MSRISKIEIAIVVGIVLFMILQYPLHASFPVGGDTTRYLLRVLESFPAILTNSWYPASIFLLWTTSWIPVGLEMQFIWWVTLGHIATAAAVGFVAYRIGGLRAAAISALVWALATIDITRHTEDATLAQLLSLPAFIVAVERAASTKWKWSIVLTVVAYFLHPISGLLATIAIILSFLSRALRTLPFQKILLSLGIAGAGVAVAILVFSHFQSANVLFRSFEENSYPLTESIYRPFGVFVLLSTFGVIALARSKQKTHFKITLFILASLALLTTFNDRLGVGIFPDRFLSYYILTVSIFAGTGLLFLVSNILKQPALQGAVILLLIFTVLPDQLRIAASTFNFYESPGKYARLHRDERAAIDWMKSNLSPTSYIVSSDVNRHSEWIPIFSDLKWEGIKPSDSFWKSSEDELREVEYTHLVLFRNRESDNVFPFDLDVAYENDGAVILTLPK
ncbi:MAG: hypothetical protein WEC84_01205 [Candidatus Andersenbacteria bacterium]